MQAAEGGAAAAGKTAEAGRNGLSIKKEPFRNVGGGGPLASARRPFQKGKSVRKTFSARFLHLGKNLFILLNVLTAVNFWCIVSANEQAGRL